MKFTFALCLVVLLMVFEPIYAVKICTPTVGNCNENVPVCGRFGRSNLCKKFKNKCLLEIESCTSTAVYTPVSAERCTGIALNTRRSCYGLNNNNNGVGIVYPAYKPGFKPGYNPGGKWSNWFGYGNVNGVQPNQPAVKPITINAGK
ncbi:hypothetical protein DOY81_006491 [Sarcophaga bullata]|nr:hypothetical protein DOY81_006491 [Sarcophaga bullata]